MFCKPKYLANWLIVEIFLICNVCLRDQFVIYKFCIPSGLYRVYRIEVVLSSSIRDKIAKKKRGWRKTLKNAMLKGVYFIIFSQRGHRNYVWPWFIFIYVGRSTNNRLCEVHTIDACLWLIFLCPIRDKHSNESWNCFFNNSITRVLLSVLENFCRRFSRPDWPSMGLRGCFWGKRTNKGAITKKEANRAGDWEWKGTAPFSSPQTLVNIAL